MSRLSHHIRATFWEAIAVCFVMPRVMHRASYHRRQLMLSRRTPLSRYTGGL